MGTIKSLNKWANAHTYYPLDILRFALGVFLFMKGVHFLNNMQSLIQLFEPIKDMPGGMIWLHYVLPAHFIGGILIAFGLLTRWAIIAQIPILIGAILINLLGEFHTVDFILATITLMVCVFFLFYGSGKHSADYYFKMQQ
ncbi:MAG: DoxX family protein [Gelidibacter sp.]